MTAPLTTATTATAVPSFRSSRHAAANGEDPRTSDYFDGVYYPSSDGRPMAENVAQWKSVVTDGGVLDCHYEDDAEVMVAGDVAIYPIRGNPRISVAPDLLVAFGVPKLPHRRSYKVWVEGKAPDFVMEVASPNTWKEDRGRKWQRYLSMGVREYWLFDPTGEFFDPPLEGYRSSGGEFVPIERTERAEQAEPAPRLELPSDVLGLRLRPDDGHVRFHNPATGQDLRTHSEEIAARRHETTLRRQAEAKAAELEALVRQLQSQRGHGAQQ